MSKIIAFAGRKQSGKTTCAQFAKDIFYQYFPSNICEIYNFADPLKMDICINILGLTYEQCYGEDDKKNELVDCYWKNQQLTAREVMQLVGTDMFRRLKTNVWSDATIRKIQKDNPNIGLIADCRFPNEVNAIKSVGGIVIKLTRNPYNSDHSSEIALDKDKFDHKYFDLVIDNQNLSVVEQNTIIFNFLKHKGLLPL